MNVIRIKDVIKIVSLSRSTIYLLMSKDAFPKSIRLSTRAVAWRVEDIQSWLDKKFNHQIALNNLKVSS